MQNRRKDDSHLEKESIFVPGGPEQLPRFPALQEVLGKCSAPPELTFSYVQMIMSVMYALLYL